MEPYKWMNDALCAQVGGEIFFPEKGSDSGQAKRTCSRCDVRLECLSYALDEGMAYGVWGGMTERERRKMRARRVA